MKFAPEVLSHAMKEPSEQYQHLVYAAPRPIVVGQVLKSMTAVLFCVKYWPTVAPVRNEPSEGVHLTDPELPVKYEPIELHCCVC